MLAVEVLSYTATFALNQVASAPILTRGEVLSRHLDGLRALLANDSAREVLHETYGWAYRPGFARGPDTLNSAGLRASREYRLAKDSGTVRVATFGDSFVYCNEVTNADCWAAIAEGGWNTDILNYGIGGYGTDQAFLRYQGEGATYQPDVVLIGFAPTDLRRIVNRYRGFISVDEGPWFKPRFVETGQGLQLVATPVPDRTAALNLIDHPEQFREIGQNDHWYNASIYSQPMYHWSATYRLLANLWTRVDRRRFDKDRLFEGDDFRSDTEAFRIQVAVIEMFAERVKADGATPFILLLPSRGDVARAAEGAPPTYEILSDTLRSLGYRTIDPLADLSSVPETQALFAAGGHYSRRGNEIVARYVASTLGLIPRPVTGASTGH